MADQISVDMDDLDTFLASRKPKTRDELEVERVWPDLPSWVLKQYTATEWLWLSQQERDNLLNFGGTRSENLDMWTQIGG